MTKFYVTCSAAIILIMVAAVADTSWGRGFGGMHGGMRGGTGGMRRGGANIGGRRPGPANLGGARPGGANFGGRRPGAGNVGGGRPGGANLGGGRPGGANFGGGRPGGGNFGSSRPGGFASNRPNSGGAGAGPFPGGGAGGFGGRSGSGVGERAGRPNRGQMNNFLGLPSDGGLHTAAGGNRLGRDGRGLSRHPNAELRRRGDYVRRDFRGRGFYSPAWYRRYPGAWYARAWARQDLWTAMTWDAMGGYFGYGNTEPMYYDYGNTVTYQDDSVYMNGQSMGTSDEYYQQAQDLASTGAEAQPADDVQWMPLGVFAMTHDDQTKANLILQLAVNKDGIIRGNYTATVTDDTKPVQGSVDKKTQRAAWTIGDKTENVIETGIYNLTKDEAPALVHFGKHKTDQWVLVRLDKDQDDQERQQQDSSPF